jgi:hypothetical protein
LNPEKKLMTHENRFGRAGALALVVALLAAVMGQPVQAAGGGDADLRELSRYTLTMADIRKYAAANANLAKHPKAEQEDEDSEDDEGSDNESLDEMAARINKMPEARKAIESAGLTARQYAVITMALFQASMAQFAVEQGADPAKVARDASVNPANIRFVKENKAELEKLKSPNSGD